MMVWNEQGLRVITNNGPPWSFVMVVWGLQCQATFSASLVITAWLHIPHFSVCEILFHSATETGVIWLGMHTYTRYLSDIQQLVVCCFYSKSTHPSPAAQLWPGLLGKISCWRTAAGNYRASLQSHIFERANEGATRTVEHSVLVDGRYYMFPRFLSSCWILMVW